MAENQINVSKAILNIEIVRRKSKKTGKEFEALVLTLANGYQHMLFIDQAVTYMIKGLAFDTVGADLTIPSQEEHEQNKKSFLDD